MREPGGGHRVRQQERERALAPWTGHTRPADGYPARTQGNSAGAPLRTQRQPTSTRPARARHASACPRPHEYRFAGGARGRGARSAPTNMQLQRVERRLGAVQRHQKSAYEAAWVARRTWPRNGAGRVDGPSPPVHAAWHGHVSVRGWVGGRARTGRRRRGGHHRTCAAAASFHARRVQTPAIDSAGAPARARCSLLTNLRACCRRTARSPCWPARRHAWRRAPPCTPSPPARRARAQASAHRGEALLAPHFGSSSSTGMQGASLPLREAHVSAECDWHCQCVRHGRMRWQVRTCPRSPQ